MSKKAVILFGAPGAGKGTQAEKIAEIFGLAHIETSKIIENGFAAAIPNDPQIEIERQRKLNGELTSPTLFAGWFNDEIRMLANRGEGIVTSGALRTVKESELVMPEMERLYGKDNIKLILINIDEEESVKRNSKRRICKAKRHTIPSADYDPKYKDITVCPYDNSQLIIREDDRPDLLKKRYKVFLQETLPVFDYLRKHGYNIIEINGKRNINAVFDDISNRLK